MLIIVCALACEAKCLISHLRLQCKVSSPFPFYCRESVCLVISGVGKVRAAAAVSYVQAFLGNPFSPAYFNIGIAGHAHWPLGTGVLAHQIVDHATKRAFYPIFVCDRPVKTAAVRTVDKPEFSYSEEVVFDMEAAGFWMIASSFSTAELIHSYKVVSDNWENSASALTAPQIDRLISQQLPFLDAFIPSLLGLSQKLQTLEISGKDKDLFLNRWPFTATQQVQLDRLLKRWRACTSKSPSDLWNEELLAIKKGKDVLCFLRKKVSHV